jgi:hypothetical protein
MDFNSTNYENPIMHKSDILRWIGNILLMIGYKTMLWGDFKYGLLIKVIGGLLTIPFAIKLKLWDVLFLCAFFGTSEISKLIQLYTSPGMT